MRLITRIQMAVRCGRSDGPAPHTKCMAGRIAWLAWWLARDHSTSGFGWMDVLVNVIIIAAGSAVVCLIVF